MNPHAGELRIAAGRVLRDGHRGYRSVNPTGRDSLE
jgi:hypothetical protein